MPSNPIFRTQIFTTTLNSISLSEIDNYKNHLLKLHYRVSDRHGKYTQDQNILDNPLFKSLKKQIFFYSKQYLNDLGHEFEDIQISNSWNNILNKDNEVHSHNHPNSYISGVFYLSESPTIIFTDPLLDNWTFSPNFLEKSATTMELAPPFKGLILFPSFLYHHVPPSPKDGRISIAFNIIPKGQFGKETFRLNLK